MRNATEPGNAPRASFTPRGIRRGRGRQRAGLDNLQEEKPGTDESSKLNEALDCFELEQGFKSNSNLNFY